MYWDDKYGTQSVSNEVSCIPDPLYLFKWYTVLPVFDHVKWIIYLIVNFILLLPGIFT